MTYESALDSLSPLQAALAAAEATVTAAQATGAALQPLVDAAQAIVGTFRKYTIDWTPGGDTQYTSLELPPDATTNGDQASVIRDSVPEPVPCLVSHYDTTATTWSDPEPFSITWGDSGMP